MSANIFWSIPTSLELNGPILSFQTQPTDLTTANGGSVNFVGIASAVVPGQQNPNYSITNTGTIEYQWYEVGVGPVVQSGIAATNTVLYLSGLSSPVDNGRKFYIEADYKPSAYSTSTYFPDANNPIVSGDTSSPGIGTTVGRTGNAINEPLKSNIVTLIISPIITINVQPIEVVTSISTPVSFSVDATVSDGTNSLLSYQWRRNGVALSDGSTVSGATTNTLTISDSSSGTTQIDCIISHPGTNPANAITTSVPFSVGAPRDIIKFEEFYELKTSTTASLFTKNISEGSIKFISDTSKSYSIISFYAPEKPVKARITLSGSAGANNNGNLGGEGGVTTFDIILDQNTEYIVKIGSTGFPMGSTGGGGVGAFLYKKGRLVACVGGGGGAGSNNRGGSGGGINVSGENGFGRGSGSGGTSVAAGSLTSGLIAVSGSTGGKAAPCPSGGYYATKGFSACDDVGNAVRFLNQDGVSVKNTAIIRRGYKVGNAGILNGGVGNSTLGGGGGGVIGGNAATNDFAGGGGGSGYTDGSVTVITTGTGGNTSANGYITVELASDTVTSGYDGPGIYLDLTGERGNIPLNISTSEESGIFHFINIPGIANIPENLGSRTYNVTGGRVYGPCTAPNGGLYIGNETPVGGISTLVVEEGGDDWNDMILSVNRGYFRRLSGSPSTTPTTSTTVTATTTTTTTSDVDPPTIPPTIIVTHTQSAKTGYRQETFETVLRSYDKNKPSDGEGYGTNKKAFDSIAFGPGQWTLKAKHRDIEVVTTVAGAAGQNTSNSAGTALGGLGGIGNVAFRMPKDVEFTFQVGETGIDEVYPDENSPSGGQRGPDLPSGMGQGGGCTVIYKGGEVLAVSGGGGGAGRGGKFTDITSDGPPNAGGNGGGAHKDGRNGGDGAGGNGGLGATKDAPGRNKNTSLYPVDTWQRNGECSVYAPGEQDGICPCTYSDANSALTYPLDSSRKSCDKYGIARI